MEIFFGKKKLSDLKACYYIESRSDNILNDAVRETKSFLKDKIDIVNDIRVYGSLEENDSQDFFNFINTPSFFSIKKAVIIKNTEKLSKEFLKAIIDYFDLSANPADNSFFLFTGEDIRKTPQIEAVISKYGEKYKVSSPLSGDFKKKLIEKAELDGIKITPKAAALFAENVNDDSILFENEYEKLYAYVYSDKDKIINESSVKRLVSRSIDFTIFDFVDHIGAGRFNEALELTTLLQKDELSSILALSQLYRMFKAILLIKASNSGKEDARMFLEKNIKAKPYFILKVLEKYERFEKIYDFESIVRILSLINELEIRKRKISEPDALFLYNIVIKIKQIKTLKN